MGVLFLILVLLFSTLCPSSFAIILAGKRELVPLLYLSFRYLVTVSVLWLFLTIPVGLQCVVVVLPDHIHLLFGSSS